MKRLLTSYCHESLTALVVAVGIAAVFLTSGCSTGSENAESQPQQPITEADIETMDIETRGGFETQKALYDHQTDRQGS